MSFTINGKQISQPNELIPNESKEFVEIGWIAHGMDKFRVDRYKAMFGYPKTRIPPKIYRTEKIAARYGTPVRVFVKIPKP